MPPMLKNRHTRTAIYLAIIADVLLVVAMFAASWAIAGAAMIVFSWSIASLLFIPAVADAYKRQVSRWTAGDDPEARDD